MDGEAQMKRIQTVCLLVITAIVVGAALHWLRPMMIPFTLALFTAFGLSLVTDVLVRKARFPRPLALATSLLIALMVFVLFASVVTTAVRELAANANKYERSIQRIVNDSVQRLPLERWGIETGADLEQYYQMPVESVGGVLLSTTNAILDILSKSVMVMIFVLFLLIGSRRDPEQVKSGLFVVMESKIKRYLVTKAAASAATGTLVGLILSLLNVDLAVAFGLLAFLLNFIPSLGSIIATLLPLPVVLVSPEATATTVVLTLVLPGSVQLVIGNILEPKVMGDSLELHPVSILMALIFWGMLWGVVGMFLAVPITAVLKYILSKYELTSGFALIMEGRLERALAHANLEEE